jgi:hypothetical protein
MLGVVQEGNELGEVAVAAFRGELVVETPETGANERVEGVDVGVWWEPKGWVSI